MFWGFCPSCPHDKTYKTHFLCQITLSVETHLCPALQSQVKSPWGRYLCPDGGGAKENTTGIVVNPHPQIMISKFLRACYRLCGEVRVWFDFVWCQRISAEIKIETHSTLGKRQGYSLWQKKGLHILNMCCPSTEGKKKPCAWIHLLGWSFHNPPRPAMCPLATHFPAALGFEVYPGTTGFNRLIGLIIELDDGKIYRKPLYLMVKTMVSCRFSLKPIHWFNI